MMMGTIRSFSVTAVATFLVALATAFGGQAGARATDERATRQTTVSADQTNVWFSQKLKELFVRYPIIRTTADKKNLTRAAIAAFGPQEARTFAAFIDVNEKEFLSIRAAVDAAVPIVPNGKTAVVSGRSVVGMIQALVLARQGYHVTVYERRNAYGKNIQWALRQSLYDELASLDPELARKFRELAGRDLKASIHLAEDGTRTTFPRRGGVEPDPSRIPRTGSGMLDLPSTMTTDSREFTALLEKYLMERPDQFTLKSEKLVVFGPDPDGKYWVGGLDRKPDEIVIVEGANSPNRSRVGIKSVETTDSRFQIAGEVHLKANGRMAKQFRRESGDRMVTYTMETDGSMKLWVVGDIHAAAVEPGSRFPLQPDAARFTSDTPEFEGEKLRLKKEYSVEKARLLEREFRRIAAMALDVPETLIRDASVSGPYDGVGPSPFWLDQRISTSAIAGANLRLAGDAVGNATPTVGGGMQVGAVAHAERAKRMYLDLNIIDDLFRAGKITNAEAETRRAKARRNYSDHVIEDTLDWHRRGVPDMYLHIGPGVKVAQLPKSSPFALTHNRNVKRLEKEIAGFTDSEILRRSQLPTDDYYRIPSDEVRTVEGRAKWRGKLVEWAYQDFIRRTFDEGVKRFRAGEISAPMDYLRVTLPARPETASSAFKPQVFRADPYTVQLSRGPVEIRPKHVNAAQRLDEAGSVELSLAANVKTGELSGTYIQRVPDVLVGSITTPNEILRDGTEVWVNGKRVMWKYRHIPNFAETEYLEWSAPGNRRKPSTVEIKFYGRTIGTYRYDPGRKELTRTTEPRRISDFDLREFYTPDTCATSPVTAALKKALNSQ